MKPLVVSKCENMDIEQNPGPSNHINLQENASVLLQGSIHQGDEILVLIQEGVNAYHVV